MEPDGYLARFIGVALFLAIGTGWAQNATNSGADVFDAMCSDCHSRSDSGAPRIGDRREWQRRAAQGLVRLTDHALDGIRNMPPHGGQPELDRVEIERAIVYMVNQSGGNWVEPSSDSVASKGRSGAQIVDSNCALCHALGYHSAPRIGVAGDWLPRTKLGIEHLVRHASRGYGAMPSRGGNPRLTDGELRSAVLYMISAARSRGAADQK